MEGRSYPQPLWRAVLRTVPNRDYQHPNWAGSQRQVKLQGVHSTHCSSPHLGKQWHHLHSQLHLQRTQRSAIRWGHPDPVEGRPSTDQHDEIEIYKLAIKLHEMNLGTFEECAKAVKETGCNEANSVKVLQRKDWVSAKDFQSRDKTSESCFSKTMTYVINLESWTFWMSELRVLNCVIITRKKTLYTLLKP